MKTLTVGAVCAFITCMAFAQGSPSDQQQVQQTVINLFDALSARDANAVRESCTADASFNEYGKTWSVDTLIALAITKNTATDFKRTNQFDFISTTIKGDVAWATYNLHSTISASGKTSEVYWMETVITVKDKNKWKIGVLHSTRVNKP
jgi:uncharacterized protein (TIGR02246 family)